MKPWNLLLRFVLEVGAVAAIAGWALTLADGWARYAIAAGLVLGVLAVWGVFNVPGDPSRSGHAPVRVPGAVRLMIELAVFGAGAITAGLVWSFWAGIVVGTLTAIHYVVSWRRIAWLLQQ